MTDYDKQLIYHTDENKMTGTQNLQKLNSIKFDLFNIGCDAYRIHNKSSRVHMDIITKIRHMVD